MEPHDGPFTELYEGLFAELHEGPCVNQARE